jgi:3-hydroxyisobutyrate dehydrogenase
MAAIGFIGLGNMGGPMAANLVRAGHEVRGFDLSADARAALVAIGGAEADSAADAARGAEIVITMLPAGQHVRDVVLGSGGVLAAMDKGALLIDCSTIDVATARDVAAAAEGARIAMLDAPVSGGTQGAAAATLTFMVGGTEAAFARAGEVLSAMGKTIVHAGDAGAGQAAKVCNNMMLGINMIGVAEAFTLAERLGLAAEKLFEISSASSGQSWAMVKYCPVPGPVPAAPSNRGYTGGFAAALMLKDLRLSQAAAEAEGVPTPLGARAAALYAAAVAAGEGGLDFSVIARWLAQQDRAALVKD